VLFDLVPAMIWVKDTRNGFLRVNRRVVKATGLASDQIEGKSAEELFPNEAEAYYADDLEVINSGLPKLGIVEKLQGQKGQELWVRTDKVPFRDVNGKVTGLVAMVYDVTAERQNERNLAASQELLREFIQRTPAAIAMMDTEMRYLQASDRWLKDYHLDGRNIIGRSHYEIFPDSPQRWKDIHQRVLQGAVESCDEDPFPRANGGMEWLQWEARPWRQPNGEIGGLIFFTQVITARKEAEHEVRFSEQRYRSLIEASTAIVWDTPASGGFEVEQPGWKAFTGQTFEEHGGWGWLNAVHSDDQAETGRVWSAAVESRSTYIVEHRLRAADGAYHDMMVRAAPRQSWPMARGFSRQKIPQSARRGRHPARSIQMRD
jgi:PAS domain S-box-containing protein